MLQITVAGGDRISWEVKSNDRMLAGFADWLSTELLRLLLEISMTSEDVQSDNVIDFQERYCADFCPDLEIPECEHCGVRTRCTNPVIKALIKALFDEVLLRPRIDDESSGNGDTAA